MSMLKFVGQQGAEHGGNLLWPGLYGMPIRGQAGLLKDSEIDENFEIAYDFHCRDFDLSDPDHLKEYTGVMDRISNGWYIQREKVAGRDATTGAMRVYLEWCQSYGQINPKVQQRIDPSSSSIPRVG